jgi:hypothetical protein
MGSLSLPLSPCPFKVSACPHTPMSKLLVCCSDPVLEMGTLPVILAPVATASSMNLVLLMSDSLMPLLSRSSSKQILILSKCLWQHLLLTTALTTLARSTSRTSIPRLTNLSFLELCSCPNSWQNFTPIVLLAYRVSLWFFPQRLLCPSPLLRNIKSTYPLRITSEPTLVTLHGNCQLLLTSQKGQPLSKPA